MDTTVLVTIVVAGLSGGLITEVFRSFRDRKKTALEAFYPTWKEEMARTQEEIRLLRIAVVALSQELHRMGGDPLAIRAAAEAAAKLPQPPTE